MNTIYKLLKRSSGFPKWILLVQILTFVAIVLNVPVMRQIFGFIYLCFVPGITILKILRARMDMVETTVFSLGLSLAFLMFSGFLVNEFLPGLGISDPLSPRYLFFIIGATTLLLSVICLITCNKESNFAELKIRLSASHLAILCLPVLSVLGVTLVNNNGNNSLLMITTLAVLASIVAATLFKGEGKKHYPLLILSVSIALLLQNSLMTNYIHGFDIHGEFYVYTLTSSSSFWNPNEIFGSLSDYNSMLSITILPTIFSNILDLTGTWVFKTVFPIIYAFVPMCIYLFARKWLGEEIAFLGAFLFMADYVFTQPLSNAKQMIAELFFVLLVIIIFGRARELRSKGINFFLLVIFTFSLVVSHYGTAIVFLILASLVFLIELIRKREIDRSYTSQMLLFFTITFAWYLFTSAPAGAFNRITTAVQDITRNLRNFFILESRGSDVLAGVGLQAASTPLHQVNRVLHYITQFLIVVGVLALFQKGREWLRNTRYAVLSFASFGLILMMVIFPFFSLPLRVERLYNILLLVLGPFGILGGTIVLRRLVKRRTNLLSFLLTLIVLTPFFLFQTGFVFEITSDNPSSVSLSFHRMGSTPYVSWGFVDERDVLGANWLSLYRTLNERVFTQFFSTTLGSLQSYGTVYVNRIWEISDMARPTSGSFLFLTGHERTEQNLSQWTALEFWPDKIYDNGFSEVYKTPIN